jgi:hypothetical protein
LLASGALLLVPVYTGLRVEATATAGQALALPPTPGRHRATLWEVNGPGVLAPLAVPVVLTALPLAASWTPLRTPARVLAAVLLTGFVLVAGFSIGLFYLPAVGALLGAILWSALQAPAREGR